MRPVPIQILPISLLPLLVSAALLPMAGQKAARKAPPTFQQETSRFFAGYCASCHNAKTLSGSLNLQTLSAPNSIARHRDTWESVVRKVRTGEMPPKGSPRPAAAEVKAVADRIEQEFARADRLSANNPGRVTARRLNRAEYNNTIRDLLAVDTRPADDFPQDDSGYGFDNIGDVLSLSPAQMEMYLTAAERIARNAVFGPEILKPALVRHEAAGRNIVASTKVPATYDATGLSLPNTLHTTHRFPVTADYLFRVGLNGVRPLGSEALHIGLWIDGSKAKALEIAGYGTAAFSVDRQEFSGRTVECKLRVPAGDHWISATIERIYEGLPVDYGGPNPSHLPIIAPVFRPPPGATPERIEFLRKRFESRPRDRAPANDARVSSLEIGGPYDQVKGPSQASLSRIFTCGHLNGKHTAACTQKIIGDLARRAFRRPVTQQEIDRLANLVTMARSKGDSYEEGICLALQGILVSPHFLFRVERDPAAGDETHLITQHELATRLSYFLWSSMPDDELRDCADRQTLRTPAVLRKQIARMLADPRSHALAENFGGQWLQFRAIESAKPDRKLFPDFDDYLRTSMRRETEMFIESLLREDRSILDLLNGKYTYVNGKLAAFYGISGVEGPEFRRVDLSGTPRGGVLTQASILTVTSYPNRTSPVLRGKWILENILNAPPPLPPPNVPNLDTSGVGTQASLRVQLEEHRKNPTCAACHSRMDPLGFGLENFNAVGAWRVKDGQIPIDSSGSLPDGRSFQGADGLKSILNADKSAFTQCLTSKLLTYALGRGLERYDNSTVSEISKHVAESDYRVSALVWEIVNSKPFQMRRGDRQK